jgi:tetrahydromethanopterin S-methyltransferase subunit A
LVDKKEVINGWPLETGDYITGDINSPVAVVTLGSHMSEPLIEAGAAVSGPLHTENLGIEKIVVNTISNTNLRYLIVCGSEVQGHITGQTMQALYDNGIDPDKKNIIGSPGAIPFVENLTVEAVERFQDQFTLINMVDNENEDEIIAKIKECINNNPEPYEKDAMIVEINEKEEQEEQEDEIDITTSTGNVDTASLRLLEIEDRIRNIKTEVKQVAIHDKLLSGYYAGKIEGIAVGFILTIILVILLIH